MDPIKNILEQKLPTKEQRDAKNKAADDCLAKAKKEIHENMDSIHITYSQGVLNYLNAYRPHKEDLIGAGGSAILEKILKGAATPRSLGIGPAVSVGKRMLPLYQDLSDRIFKAYRYEDQYAAAKEACNKLRP